MTDMELGEVASCQMGWRFPCTREARWQVGGHFVSCDACAATCLDKRRITRDEAKALMVAMHRARERMRERKAPMTNPWRPPGDGASARARAAMKRAAAVAAETKARRAA